MTRLHGSNAHSRMDLEHRERLAALRKALEGYDAGPVISREDMVLAVAAVPALEAHWRAAAAVLDAARLALARPSSDHDAHDGGGGEHPEPP